MRLKFLFFVCVCLLLFIISSGFKINQAEAESIIQEDSEMAEQKTKLRNSMLDIVTIATALADFITDNGIAPEQAGALDENFEFYKVLAPFYVRNLPIYDGWGNAYRVYCGEACNGIYSGVSDCISDDFVIVSYGRDGKKEDWEFDRKNPKAGIYVLGTLNDFNKDIVNWNGAWIRAPQIERRLIAH